MAQLPDSLTETIDQAAAWVRGESVRLRGLQDDDIERLARWNQQPEVGIVHSGTLAPASMGAQRALFARWGSGDDGVCGFAVETLETKEHVGALCIKRKSASSGSLAIVLGPDFLGHGYGSDAVRVATRYALTDMHLHRVELQVLATNVRAVKAYERAGYETEGRLRETRQLGGVWQDELVMSRIAPNAQRLA